MTPELSDEGKLAIAIHLAWDEWEKTAHPEGDDTYAKIAARVALAWGGRGDIAGSGGRSAVATLDAKATSKSSELSAPAATDHGKGEGK